MWLGFGIGKGAKETSWKVVFCLQLPKILILLKKIINNCFLIINSTPLFEFYFFYFFIFYVKNIKFTI